MPNDNANAPFVGHTLRLLIQDGLLDCLDALRSAMREHLGGGGGGRGG